MDWSTVDEVNQAVFKYGESIQKLKELQRTTTNLLPYGTITVGTIGEYYCFVALKHQFSDSTVKYGAATEKSWDIEVVDPANKSTKYQVKTVSLNSKSLSISNIKAGFDWLIVIVLSEDYFPEKIYKIKPDFKFSYTQSFAIPDPRKPKSGSKALEQYIEEMDSDFFNGLAERL
ncbi:TPA: hypothetical protein N2940_004148 [Vibrio parahaemolyticus]|nr:hypothetical protein [Vibrio parahaemolyticus]